MRICLVNLRLKFDNDSTSHRTSKTLAPLALVATCVVTLVHLRNKHGEAFQNSYFTNYFYNF
jgi:hypothetical protein